jgi:hypothetical protein
MKVIIELNKDISIENIEGSDNEIKLNISIAGKACSYAIVNIDELKLALRKLI